MSKSLNFLILLLIVLGMVSWNSCAGGKKTVKESEAVQEGESSEYDEIERLLGISREEEKKGEKAEQKNDDLITLLEVDEGKKKGEVEPGQANIEDKRLLNLQKKVEELQKELKKKDMEIADLKAQLMLKEEELQKLQRQSPTSTTSFYPTPSSGVQPVASSEYERKYKEGLALFHQKQYDAAIQVFEQLLATSLNHPLSDNAQYWIGECYYAKGQYQKAIMAFEKVFTFRNSNKNDYAQFKIGQCYFMLGNKQRARQEFQQLVDNYPDSELLGRAKDYLARL